MSRLFGDGLYDKHFVRMRNELPNWEEAEKNPRRHINIQSWYPEDKNARILDFGCGWGHQLISLWCAGYKNVKGVDISQEQIDMASKAANGRIELLCKNGLDYLQENQNAFDVIIMNDIIEHFDCRESEILLKGVYRSLAKGGRVIIRTPNMSSILSAYSRHIDYTHVNGFTEFSIQQLLDKCGFEGHKLILDPWKSNLTLSHFWRMLRVSYLVKPFLNHCLHKFIYWLRNQTPSPTVFASNFTVYSFKPMK